MKKHETLIRQYKLTFLEKILAAVLLIVGIGMFIMAQKLPVSSSVVNDAGFFPKIVAAGFVIISIILFISSFDRREDVVTMNWFGILMVLVWVVFGLLCNQIGFILSGIFAMAITLFLFGVENRRTIVLVSIVSPIIIYVVLGLMMGVRLPTLFI